MTMDNVPFQKKLRRVVMQKFTRVSEELHAFLCREDGKRGKNYFLLHLHKYERKTTAWKFQAKRWVYKQASKKHVFENWNVTSCSMKEAHWRFRKSYFLSDDEGSKDDQEGNRILCKVSTFLPSLRLHNCNTIVLTF